jgi:hypothetical protein
MSFASITLVIVGAILATLGILAAGSLPLIALGLGAIAFAGVLELAAGRKAR